MAKIGVVFIFLICMNSCPAKRCDKIHEYLDEEGVCRNCETCEPGNQPSLHLCGYGTKNPLYACLPCPSGSYSLSNDYSFCLTCSPCAKLNSAVATSCSSTSAAECGECYIGYFRPKKSDGNTDPECFKCEQDSTHPECLREPADWKILGLTMSAIVAALAVVVVCCFCLWKRAKKNRSGPKPRRSSKPGRFSFFHKRSLESTATSSTSSDPLTTGMNCGSTRLSVHSSEHSFPDPTNYSGAPTEEFLGSGAYPNLPTIQFSKTECQNPQRPDASLQAGIHIYPSNFELNASNSRLEYAYRTDVGAFDTSSVQKSFTSNTIPS